MKPYYEHNGIVIYHGDCREVLPTLGAVDLVLTDPPYGVDLGNHQASKETRPGWLAKQAYSNYDDTAENLESIVIPALSDALALSERGIVFCAGHKIRLFPPPTEVGGVYLPAATGRNPWGFQSLAHCLFYGKAPDVHLGSKATAIMSSASSRKIIGHPCPKPIEWMLWAVALGSRPGETVLDPFMGSGTTLVAAKQLGRKAIGIEIEERYCEIAARRLDATPEPLPFPDYAPAPEQAGLFTETP
jgi:DNA modification methylase